MELITDHLDIWTASQTPTTTGRSKSTSNQSIHGIKKLRELILELAVHGKLVPQDSNNKPASKLLEKIAAEKAKLMKEGKIKKQKPLPPIDEGEKQFDLPEGWERIQFGTVAVIERGGSPRPIKSYLTDNPEGLNWIKIGDTSQGGKYITSTKEKIRIEGLSKTRRVYPGDFLLTNSMSFGRPYITQIEGCIHDGWLRISPPETIDKNYLYLLLSSPYILKAFQASAAGAVVLNLNADKVRELVILIPPVEEQHRIVAKVDELMALCDQLEQQQTDSNATHQTLVETVLAALTRTATEDSESKENAAAIFFQHFDTLFTTEHSIDQLKQTILQLAVMGKLVPQDSNDEPVNALLKMIAEEKFRLFNKGKIRSQKPQSKIRKKEKPFELPRGWEWVRLGTIWQDSFYGPRFGKEEYVTTGGYPTIRTTDMSADGFIKLKQPPHVHVLNSKLDLYRLEQGDILITRSGSIGTMAIYDLELDAIPSAYLIRVRFSRYVYPKFILKLLLSPFGQDLLGLSIAAVGVPNINATKMAAFPIPFPPLPEQHRIVAKVDELMALCDTLKARLSDARTTQLQLADTIVEQAVA